MIAPLFNVTPTWARCRPEGVRGGDPPRHYRAWGVMLAGLLFGVVESLITAAARLGVQQILTFTLVIVRSR